ncbi:hypothetical protein EMIHUDRAFT_252880 [Emiliania huxleyi CCMP1516]|uniref:Uncharacterized protein n=2 Tax=Emiliania huxleyi TaxID=2903 RepID=A0A0D3KFH6_EMIH1|nr:hypothetical protein EMIHUDRAFT_252880 [Emiliania huxleyi CCMP1516]EOD34511.1 hypothetical protein EMIHUDRAFT_252880 [Emiliania huxleyi CCMP1516]|eukprot:XP_005786940.1 hypothetical protein EMIHUDRAFT_252880 [Emiliania huxleyi CCMP1516]
MTSFGMEAMDAESLLPCTCVDFRPSVAGVLGSALSRFIDGKRETADHGQRLTASVGEHSSSLLLTLVASSLQTQPAPL